MTQWIGPVVLFVGLVVIIRLILKDSSTTTELQDEIQERLRRERND